MLDENDIHTYRFEITVYDILFVKQTQAFNDRVTKAPNQTHAETIVVILLDQFI